MLQSDGGLRIVATNFTALGCGWGTTQQEPKAKAPSGLIPMVRQVYSGCIAGYNAYLKTGKPDDRTCKAKAWVHPLDMTDTLLRGYQIVTEASSATLVQDGGGEELLTG